MASFVLTVVDTQGIQRYIFGTNKLAQNVGASYLVKQATQQWVVEALPSSNNIISDLRLNDSRRIEDGTLDAEVVYFGGGNAVILFKSMELARDFARKLPRRALIEAPGLNIVLAHSRPFAWESEPLGGKNGVVAATMKTLARRKHDRALDAPLLGLSVTATGAFSGLPATTQLNDEQLIASEAEAKMEVADAAHRLLTQSFDWDEYAVLKELDHLGRSEGERSFVAIVHVDVNGMGQKVEKIRDHFPQASQNRDYVLAMRSFSDSMKEASNYALSKVISVLKRHVQDSDEGQPVIVSNPDNGLHVPLSWDNNQKQYFLPIRPIIYGGDDVTFITDGRLGLSLSALYLKALTTQSLRGPDGHWPITARAGVTIAKTHFPFARAYSLTEELAASAKAFITATNDAQLSALDWHFVSGSLLGDLNSIREKSYRAENDYHLEMRPIALQGKHADWRTWNVFSSIVFQFQTDENWREHRNKVKRLREILRKGSTDAIRHFLDVYSLSQLPKIPNLDSKLPEFGWLGERTPYFDAIEAMDFFIPLSNHVDDEEKSQ